jgi:hypothetical protein
MAQPLEGVCGRKPMLDEIKVRRTEHDSHTHLGNVKRIFKIDYTAGGGRTGGQPCPGRLSLSSSAGTEGAGELTGRFESLAPIKLNRDAVIHDKTAPFGSE